MGQDPISYITDIVDNQSGRELSAEKLTDVLSRIIPHITDPDGLEIINLYLTKIIDNTTDRELTIEKLTAVLSFLESTLTGDDKGISVLGGQFSVGSPSDPREMVVGEGDSYPVPLAFHCTIADTADLTVINAIDVATILQSDDESTTGLFDGVDSGNYLLVGSDYTYGGVKAKVDTLAVVEPNNVIGEYLQTDTPLWTVAPFMATDSDFPMTQKANQIATESDTSEQWRFGFNPLILPVPWDLVTMTINGTEYTKYWARFRITSNITSDPIMQQIKLHTNRWECNADGNTEYFGRARYPKQLLAHWHLTQSITGVIPLSEEIVFANGLSLSYTSNEWRNGQTDGKGGYVVIPDGIDTSIPLQFDILWHPLDNNSGDIDFELLTAQKEIGDLMDTSTEPGSFTTTTVININEDNILKKTSILFLANELIPGEILGFGINRLGAADDYGANIAIVSIGCTGYFWRP